jgi:hypothetical protein
VNEDVFEVLDLEVGYFHIRMLVKNKGSGVICNIVNVYGAPHARDKERIPVELVHIFYSQ